MNFSEEMEAVRRMISDGRIKFSSGGFIGKPLVKRIWFDNLFDDLERGCWLENLFDDLEGGK